MVHEVVFDQRFAVTPQITFFDEQTTNGSGNSSSSSSSISSSSSSSRTDGSGGGGDANHRDLELEARYNRLQTESNALLADVRALSSRAAALVARLDSPSVAGGSRSKANQQAKTAGVVVDGGPGDAPVISATLEGAAKDAACDNMDLAAAKRMAREALAELTGGGGGGGGGDDANESVQTGGHGDEPGQSPKLGGAACNDIDLAAAKRMAREALAELTGGGGGNGGDNDNDNNNNNDDDDVDDDDGNAGGNVASNANVSAQTALSVTRVGRHGFVVEVDASITSFGWKAVEPKDSGRLGDRRTQRVDDCQGWLTRLQRSPVDTVAARMSAAGEIAATVLHVEYA